MDVTVVLLLLFWLMQLNPSDILHKSNTTGFVCFVCFFFCHCVSPKFYYNPPTTRQNLKRRNKCCWLTACHLLSQDFIKIPACRRLAMRSTLILSIINYLQVVNYNKMESSFYTRFSVLVSLGVSTSWLLSLCVLMVWDVKGSQNSESGEIDMLVRSLPVLTAFKKKQDSLSWRESWHIIHVRSSSAAVHLTSCYRIFVFMFGVQDDYTISRLLYVIKLLSPLLETRRIARGRIQTQQRYTHKSESKTG